MTSTQKFYETNIIEKKIAPRIIRTILVLISYIGQLERILMIDFIIKINY